MGHNLGMRHDFKRTDSRGRNCYGYMDYEDSTNYWSTCSVEDFMGTKKDCLRAANNRDDDDNELGRDHTFHYIDDGDDDGDGDDDDDDDDLD